MRKLYSEEAEHSVLGSILIDNEKYHDFKLEADMFYFPQNVDVFNTIQSLFLANKPVDAITVSEANNNIDLAYLVDMVQGIPSTANFKHYAQAVKDRYQERQLVFVCNQINELIHDTNISTVERVKGAQSLFTALSMEEAPSTQMHVKKAVGRVLERLDNALNSDGPLGLLTGYADVDKRLGSLNPGEFYVLAARPAMGKTTYATGLAKHVAQSGKKVLFFSLEMPAEQLARRMMACQSTIHLGELKDPRKVKDSDEFWSKVSAGAISVGELPIEIDDQASLSIDDLTSRAKREHRKGEIGLIIVDHINIAKGTYGSRSRVEEVKSISGGLKALAKELKCPVLGLAQLNRKCEERLDKRPMMSDLRESGDIEQDADVVQFLYRDEVYNEDSEYKGVAEVITAKFRDGEIGKDMLIFEGQYNRFRDLDFKITESQSNAFHY